MSGRHAKHELESVKPDYPAYPSDWRATCTCGESFYAVPRELAEALISKHVADPSRAEFYQ